MSKTDPERAAVAAVFPGQGSQTDGLRELVTAELPELAAALEQEVGTDAYERCAESTRIQQPVLYCAALAHWRRYDGPAPVAYAGHSLGEISALTAAGALDPADGLRVVAVRGRVMDEANDSAPGAMVAIIGRSEVGADAARIAEACGVVVANDNSPKQVVLSGPVEGIERVGPLAEEAGLRAQQLPVCAAFHSPLMAPAAGDLADVLADVPIATPAAPVFSCVTAEPFTDVRRQLVESLTSRVRWREVVLAMHAAGAGAFVESGPGRVLTGLVRRTLPDVDAQTLDAELSRA